MGNIDQPYLSQEVNSHNYRDDELFGHYPGNADHQIYAQRRKWPWRYIIFFITTVITTTVAGAAQVVKLSSVPESIPDSIRICYLSIVSQTLAGDLIPLANGLLFAFTLLFILGAHELGHYFACRYYGIASTLPFFIPAPPYPLTPFGTFGAVIKIKAPIESRRALFDIGIAGPLAGFAFALPASLIGLLVAKAALPPLGGSGGYQFNDPLLFIIIAKLFGVPKWIEWNPVYYASWAAVLVTSLNLFPVGQLDGGHILYAVLGRRLHRIFSILIVIAVAVLSVLSFTLYNSPMWFLWTLVLVILLKMGHPPIYEDQPLGTGRQLLALVALLVFTLCFMPFPITLS